MENVTCPYCGQKTSEKYCREDHNEYCPMQYPIASCRDHALNNWQRGFDSPKLADGPPANLENPVFMLGYKMGHPESNQ